MQAADLIVVGTSMKVYLCWLVGIRQAGVKILAVNRAGVTGNFEMVVADATDFFGQLEVR